MNDSRPCPLAVFSPLIGRWGQPWIKTHIEDILPSQTAVVAICVFERSGPCWSVDAPLLYVPPRLPATIRSRRNDETMFQWLPVEHKATFWSAEHSQRIGSFLVQHGVEAILAQWLDVSLPLVEMAERLGIRYYCQAHGSDITAGLRDTEVRRVYNRYSDIEAVIAPSEFGRQQLVQLGINPARTRVIRHAVHVPDTPITRNGGPAVRCLIVGRMDVMKGPMIALEAFRRALQSFPNLSLDYVGDGAMMLAIRQWTRACRIDDRVTLHGFLPHAEVLDLMTRSHILIQASVTDDIRYDTCPVTVAEAMAHGLAIVACRHGGIPEQVVDSESGCLVDEYDTEAIADRIVMIARDPALRHRLGEAAWLRAGEVFSARTIRRQWLELLQLTDFLDDGRGAQRTGLAHQPL